MLTIGIDIGSITTKIAVMDNQGLIHTKVSFTGYNAENAWRNIFNESLKQLQLKKSSISGIIATGYGRNGVSIADKTVTEIKCHAQGAMLYQKNAASVIDIGGQDSKFIRIGTDGIVTNFVMNDKCAAGTGRFLEVMARALEVDLANFGKLSLKAKKPSSISSMCTVFAESEVISLISKGASRENIIAGIHESIAIRLQSMIGRSGIEEPVILTGGVAQNIGIQTALEKKFKIKIRVPETAQVNGAIGAALLARNI